MEYRFSVQKHRLKIFKLVGILSWYTFICFIYNSIFIGSNYFLIEILNFSFSTYSKKNDDSNEIFLSFSNPIILSRRWQAPGAVKKRRRKKKPNREKFERSCQCLYICFCRLREKVEFKVRIKPCPHQPNRMKFLL